jgi:hypothetical protein
MTVDSAGLNVGNTPSFVEHHVPRGDGRVYARDYKGAGPAFVLMHGFPDNLHIWDDLVPHLTASGTFEDANVDIYIGASAPLIALLSTKGRLVLKLAFGWNLLGLLALTNVVTRAVLTSPGPLNLIHSEIPNRMFGTFPFVFIPGFFVPLAVTLHILAIRAIIASKAQRN